MKTPYNFQLRSLSDPKLDWEGRKPKVKAFQARTEAVALAKRAAKILKVEIRLTTGNYEQASGAYIR